MSGLFDSEFVVGGDAPIYTASADAVVMSLILTNSHFGTLPVTVSVQRGSAIVPLANGLRLPAGSPHDVLAGSKVALKQGDKIYVYSPVANVITGILSAYKDQ